MFPFYIWTPASHTDHTNTMPLWPYQRHHRPATTVSFIRSRQPPPIHTAWRLLCERLGHQANGMEAYSALIYTRASVQLYQSKATTSDTYCMAFTTWKIGRIGNANQLCLPYLHVLPSPHPTGRDVPLHIPYRYPSKATYKTPTPHAYCMVFTT